MPNEITNIGRRLRARREELRADDTRWTQAYVAEQAGMSDRTLGALERGEKTNFEWATIVKVANVLDLDITAVNDKRSRITPIGSGVMAVRDAVYDTSLLPGLASEATGEPSTVAELRADLERAYGAYFDGQFAVLAAELPGLLARCRTTQSHLRNAKVAGVYAHVWQLAACLLTQTGRIDAALAATERAIHVAQDDVDPWRQATMYGTYAWVLLHAGRHLEGEQLAVKVADSIKPELTPKADRSQLIAWGGLTLHAAVLAGSAGRLEEADDYFAYARAGAGLLLKDQSKYWVPFGTSHVGVQMAHVNTAAQRPEEALDAHRKVRPKDLKAVQSARHLLNYAEIQRLMRRRDHAEAAAKQAVSIGGTEWFRQQRFGATLVDRLERDQARASSTLRGLRALVGENVGGAL